MGVLEGCGMLRALFSMIFYWVRAQEILRPFWEALVTFRTKNDRNLNHPKPNILCHIHQHANNCRFLLNRKYHRWSTVIPGLKLHHSSGMLLCKLSVLISETPGKSFEYRVILCHTMWYYVILLRPFLTSNLECVDAECVDAQHH